DGDAFVGELDGERNDPLVFGEVERGGFAGGADGDEAVDALRDLEFNLLAQASFIQLSIAERRHHRCHCTAVHIYLTSFITRFISRTASRRPVKIARLTIAWPMFSSRMSSMAAMGPTLR